MGEQLLGVGVLQFPILLCDEKRKCLGCGRETDRALHVSELGGHVHVCGPRCALAGLAQSGLVEKVMGVIHRTDGELRPGESEAHAAMN